MWDYTNAENQVEHYKNAGLNVGLMYEGGGGSASTGSFGTGQSQVGKLDIAQNMMAQKQIELIDAQTDKTKAEAENLRGVDRENKATQTLDLLQGINNKKAQETLTKIQSDIAGVDKQIKNETYEEAVEYIRGMTSYQSQQIDQLRYSNAVDKATVNEKVATIKATLSSILLNNELTKAKADNTIQLTEESRNKILQEWQKLIIDTERLDNEQKKVKIEEFKANLSSEYQGVSNVLGKMMNDFIGLGKTEENKELHNRVKY